jgi:hypothetical protein
LNASRKNRFLALLCLSHVKGDALEETGGEVMRWVPRACWVGRGPGGGAILAGGFYGVKRRARLRRLRPAKKRPIRSVSVAVLGTPAGEPVGREIAHGMLKSNHVYSGVIPAALTRALGRTSSH